MGAGDEIPSLHGLYYLILLGKPLGPPILKFSNQSTKKQGQSQKHRSNCRPSNPSILGHVQSWSTELSGLAWVIFQSSKYQSWTFQTCFPEILEQFSVPIWSAKDQKKTGETPKKRIKKGHPACKNWTWASHCHPGSWFQSVTVTSDGKSSDFSLSDEFLSLTYRTYEINWNPKFDSWKRNWWVFSCHGMKISCLHCGRKRPPCFVFLGLE